MIKVCIGCNQEFNTEKHYQKFCSRKCSDKSRSIKISCLQCQKEFWIGGHRVEKTKFCSRKCVVEYHQKEVKCKKCNKLFQTSKSCKNIYCSKKCSDNYSRIELICSICNKKYIKPKHLVTSSINYCSKKCFDNRAPKIDVKCSGCGKAFKSSMSKLRYVMKAYCSSECRIKHGSYGRIGKYNTKYTKYDKFVRKIRSTLKYKQWRELCLERDRFCCTKCDSKDKLAVHHKIKVIWFVRKYGLNQVQIENDKLFFDTNNGETLCIKCHSLIHIDCDTDDENNSILPFLERETNKISMAVGRRVRELRKEKNIKQHELAKICNISNTHLNAIELGYKKIQLETIMKIATVLNTNTEDLLIYTKELDNAQNNIAAAS